MHVCHTRCEVQSAVFKAFISSRLEDFTEGWVNFCECLNPWISGDLFWFVIKTRRAVLTQKNCHYFFADASTAGLDENSRFYFSVLTESKNDSSETCQLISTSNTCSVVKIKWPNFSIPFQVLSSEVSEKEESVKELRQLSTDICLNVSYLISILENSFLVTDQGRNNTLFFIFVNRLKGPPTRKCLTYICSLQFTAFYKSDFCVCWL